MLFKLLSRNSNFYRNIFVATPTDRPSCRGAVALSSLYTKCDTRPSGCVTCSEISICTGGFPSWCFGVFFLLHCQQAHVSACLRVKMVVHGVVCCQLGTHNLCVGRVWEQDGFMYYLCLVYNQQELYLQQYSRCSKQINLMVECTLVPRRPYTNLRPATLGFLRHSLSNPL